MSIIFLFFPFSAFVTLYHRHNDSSSALKSIRAPLCICMNESIHVDGDCRIPTGGHFVWFCFCFCSLFGWESILNGIHYIGRFVKTYNIIYIYIYIGHAHIGWTAITFSIKKKYRGKKIPLLRLPTYRVFVVVLHFQYTNITFF